MFHREGHPKVLRIFNLLFAILALIFAIVLQYMTKNNILAFLILNSWLILNLVFLFVGHHQLISLLKYRYCLVYVLFGLIAFFQIINLIEVIR